MSASCPRCNSTTHRTYLFPCSTRKPDRWHFGDLPSKPPAPPPAPRVPLVCTCTEPIIDNWLGECRRCGRKPYDRLRVHDE